jgi:hypothetical protein
MRYLKNALNNMRNQITPFGRNIDVDADGRLSMTDLWKEAGSPEDKRPNDWQNIDQSKAFIKAACKILNTAMNGIIKSRRGKGGGTYAHAQVAAEYAQYLNPELALYVNEIFLNPEAATAHAVRVWEKKGKSKGWIQERMHGIANRKEFTDTLKNHGVLGSGYKDCTNAIYKPLWGGEGAATIREKKGLPVKSNTRESMTEIELASVRLAELLAAETIEQKTAIGNRQCKSICESAGTEIAKSIISHRKTNQNIFL